MLSSAAIPSITYDTVTSRATTSSDSPVTTSGPVSTTSGTASTTSGTASTTSGTASTTSGAATATSGAGLVTSTDATRLVTSALLDTRRSSSLRGLSPRKLPRMRLFKTNSVSGTIGCNCLIYIYIHH